MSAQGNTGVDGLFILLQPTAAPEDPPILGRQQGLSCRQGFGRHRGLHPWGMWRRLVALIFLPYINETINRSISLHQWIVWLINTLRNTTMWTQNCIGYRLTSVNEQSDTKAFGDHVLAELLPLLLRFLSVTELNHAQIQRKLTTSFSLNSSVIPRNYDDPKPIVRVRLDRIQDRQRIKEISSVELGSKFAACGGIWQSITAIRRDGEGQNGRILNIYGTTWDVQNEMLARQAEITSILGVSNDCRVVNRDYLVKVMGLRHSTNKDTMPDLTQHMAKCSRDHGVSIREAYWSQKNP